jgi:PAS domain S-box-containing protein
MRSTSINAETEPQQSERCTADVTAENAELRRANAELAQEVARLEAEKRFIAAIVDHVSVGIVACDAHGAITLLNPAARTFHGFAAGPLPQQPKQYDLYLDDGQTPMPVDQIPLLRLLHGEEIGQVETVVKPTNGASPKRIIVGGHAFFDAAGNKLGAVVSLHDITERAAAEERFRTLFQHSSDAHLLFDDRGIIDCNQATIALLGCSDKAAVLSLHPAMLSPEFQPDGRRSMEKCIEMDNTARLRGVHRFEWIHRKMDGTDFPVEVTLTPVKLKGKDSMIVVWHDLTEQKRAEAALNKANQELRENEQRYRVALAAGAMGTFTLDLKRGVVTNDEVMNRLHGLDPSVLEWKLETGFGRVHPDDRAKTRASLEKLIATGHGDLTEYRIIMPDGSIRWLAGIAGLVGPHAEHLVVGVQFDITQRKLNEERMRRAREGAEAANRAKGEFLANMSHEIRTPMTAILGHVDLLDQSASTPAQRREHLEVIRRNGRHLLSVLNDILDLSKIEAGKMSVERIAFSPRDAVQEVASLVEPRALQKGIGFVVEVRESTPAVILSDPTRLRQILLNLVGNSIKFTEKGSVRLVVDFEAGEGPARIRFDVIDTGIGMTAEQIASLFTAFSQADTSTSRRFGGSGLGLAICKRLSDMLGGTISVTSDPGKGSTFCLRLDVGTDQPSLFSEKKLRAQGSRKSAPGAKAVGKAQRRIVGGISGGMLGGILGRILVAEDSPDISSMVRAMLEGAGWSVEIAVDGRGAVDQVIEAQRAGRPYDLVLMDMQMPVLDGYAATRELRAKGFDSLPIVAFTAHAMESEREKSAAAGCDGYLIKPTNRDELVAMIAAHLPGAAKAPLVSSLADDPLLADFIATLRPIADELSGNLAAKHLDPIRSRIHKLTGAGGMFGFPEITQAAVEARDAFAGEGDSGKIAEAVSQLIGVLRRVGG